jgi:hypothetical protein
VSETFSQATQNHVELRLAEWLRRFERDLDNIKALDTQETDTLLRFIYADKYDAMRALETTPFLPRSVLGCFMYVAWPSHLRYQGTVRVRIHTAETKLPAIFGFNNILQVSGEANVGELAALFGGLPARHQQAIQELVRVADAILDLGACMTAYTRARWLLHQWPSALAFFPEHTQASLKARAFKRPPPKHVRLLKPETLDTLTWLCLIYPITESQP